MTHMENTEMTEVGTDVNQTEISKQVISITDMAVMCNLSRARFYQLSGH
jgi:hypothetical protein